MMPAQGHLFCSKRTSQVRLLFVVQITRCCVLAKFDRGHLQACSDFQSSLLFLRQTVAPCMA